MKQTFIYKFSLSEKKTFLFCKKKIPAFYRCFRKLLATVLMYFHCLLLYPTQGVAEGIFMFLTHSSVSQSVSPVFLVSATPLKPLNRIS